MTGEYRIYVKSKSVVYDFSIRRKITVIVGDSGSGKTRFVSLLKLSKMRSEVRIKGNRTFKILFPFFNSGYLNLNF